MLLAPPNGRLAPIAYSEVARHGRFGKSAMLWHLALRVVYPPMLRGGPLTPQ